MSRYQRSTWLIDDRGGNVGEPVSAWYVTCCVMAEDGVRYNNLSGHFTFIWTKEDIGMQSLSLH